MEINEIKERIEESFANRFRSADELNVFCQTVINRILNVEGYVNLDFEDVLNTLEKSDVIEIGTKIGNPDDILAILTELHDSMTQKHPGMEHSTLMMQIQFDKSSGLQIDKFDSITQFMEVLDGDVDVIWGVAFDNALGSDIRITLVEGYKGK